MNYNYNGKTIKIPDDVIENSMKYLYLTKEEAISLYLDDEGITINEEQEKLNEFANAKENKVKVVGSGSTERKPRTKIKKEDTTKEDIIKAIHECIKEFDDNATITNPTKIVEFDYDNNHYVVDLKRQRKAKN